MHGHTNIKFMANITTLPDPYLWPLPTAIPVSVNRGPLILVEWDAVNIELFNLDDNFKSMYCC